MIQAIVILITAGVALIDTTWLSDVQLLGARPDIVAVVLAYHAHRTGVQRGQITGFVTGLIEDTISAAPLGFYAIIRMIQSAVLGVTNGNIRGDALFTPMMLTAIAVIVRNITTIILATVIGLDRSGEQLFTLAALAEFAFTVLLAPVIFLLLGRVFRPFQRRGGFS